MWVDGCGCFSIYSGPEMGGTELLVEVTVLLLARVVRCAVLQAGRVYSRGEAGFPRLGSAAHRTPQQCRLCAAHKGERCEGLQPATGSQHPTRFPAHASYSHLYNPS